MHNNDSNISVYDVLPVGEENRISFDTLMQLTHECSRKRLKKRIRQERLNGALILSTTRNGGGYYKPMNDSEISDFINLYSSQAKSTFAMLKAARESLKGKDTQ